MDSSVSDTKTLDYTSVTGLLLAGVSKALVLYPCLTNNPIDIPAVDLLLRGNKTLIIVRQLSGILNLKTVLSM